MLIAQYLVASKNNELFIEEFDMKFSCWENDALAKSYCEQKGVTPIGVFQVHDDRKPIYKFFKGISESEKHLLCDAMLLKTQGAYALQADRQQRIQSAIVLGLEN